MALSTMQLFRAVAPTLCEETDDRVGIFLDVAAVRMTPAAWGNVYQQALVYHAAHLLTLSPASAGGSGGGSSSDGATAGPITKKKAGDLEITYGTASASGGSSGGGTSNAEADFTTTHYGRQLLALRDTRAAGIPTHYGLGTA